MASDSWFPKRPPTQCCPAQGLEHPEQEAGPGPGGVGEGVAPNRKELPGPRGGQSFDFRRLFYFLFFFLRRRTKQQPFIFSQPQRVEAQEAPGVSRAGFFCRDSFLGHLLADPSPGLPLGTCSCWHPVGPQSLCS